MNRPARDGRRGPVQIVEPGSWVVSGTREMILQAALGVSVGVAVRDRETGVGGVAHLLLAEPFGPPMGAATDQYAVTALPRLLQAMGEAGARTGSLEAWLAGGNLGGPGEEVGPELDFGARTLAEARRVLVGAGVRRVEECPSTFPNCLLRLDLRSLSVDTGPLMEAPPPDQAPPPPLSAAELEAAVQGVHPIPQVALRVLQLLHRGGGNSGEVAHWIRQDQVLTARVIQLCNSAFYGLDTEIDSIDRALVLLGEAQLLRLVLAGSMEQMFAPGGQGYSLGRGGLFQHSLQTARLAWSLAWQTRRMLPDVAYTAGLLHDIGKVVLDQHVAKAYPSFYHQVGVEGRDLVSVEREVLGVTHTEAGARLAERWALPAHLAEAIRHHHQPAQADPEDPVPHLVYLADLLVSRFHVGQELERVDTNGLVASMIRLGITPTDFTGLIDRVSRQVFRGRPAAGG